MSFLCLKICKSFGSSRFVKRDREDPERLQFFRHKKDSGGMSSYRVKEFIAVIRILVVARNLE